jgi:hypothetical protein
VTLEDIGDSVGYTQQSIYKLTRDFRADMGFDQWNATSDTPNIAAQINRLLRVVLRLCAKKLRAERSSP